MRWAGLLTLLFGGAAGLLWAADETKPNEPMKGFFVHEWGVWRVHDDVELANVDMRAAWDDLPKFVYGQTTNRELPRHWDRPVISVTKPVLFFHAPREMPAEIRVDFLTGLPVVWWPATETPAVVSPVLRPALWQKPARYLEWKLHLQQPQRFARQKHDFIPLNKNHWMNALRDVKCDDVYAPVGERNAGLEREKFVYYDGLLPRVRTLSIKVEKGRAALKNEATFAVFDLWVIDNRDANKPRVGRLARVDAGEAKDVALAAMKEARWVEDAVKTLMAQLTATGLNEDEAAALMKIFTTDFFHSAGVTLFYRLPQEEYERLLPLAVKPRPEKVVRVGLVQQMPNEPEFAGRIARLVKQLDDDTFVRREAAQQELEKLGRAAFGHLRRLKPTITAPEPKRRIEELLDKHDVQPVLKNEGD